MFAAVFGRTQMSTRKWVHWAKFAAVASLVLAVGWPLERASAQFGRFGSAVGGVVVDADGILRGATVDEMNRLGKLRAEQVKRLPDDMGGATALRKVSLRRLQEEFAARKEKGQTPLFTEEMECLAGLTRIQNVFVYPEEKDIVLV